MTGTAAELREEAAQARTTAATVHFPDIRKEWLRIAAEYERLAAFIDSLSDHQKSD
jgi:hypothetical protein